MASILSSFLFGLSSNLDNIVIGIAYGIKKINIGVIQNIIIASITCTGTFLSMWLGKYISRFLPAFIANILGATAIIILGAGFTVQSVVKLINSNSSKELSLKNIDDMIEYAEKSDLDNSGNIDTKEAILVALGLSFNNLGTGVAASITGVSISLTVIITFILSYTTIIFGETIGNGILGKFLGKYAPLCSGLLLIILGIIELLN